MASLRLRTDAPGYLLDDQPVDGFPDRPELQDRQRRTIARWASRFSPETLSTEQRALLDQPAPERRSSERQRELAANREALAVLNRSGLWAALDDDQRQWVLRPATHPQLDDGAAYPLSVGQLHKLTGASERQLRTWIDTGLVPSVRAASGRLVYSAGAASALLLAAQEQPEKMVLGRALRGDCAGFLHLLAAALRAWAGEHASDRVDEVEAAAAGLNRVGQLMAGGAAEPAVAEETVAIFSSQGSGKSFVGKVLVEQLALDEGQPGARELPPGLRRVLVAGRRTLPLNRLELDPSALDVDDDKDLAVIGRVVSNRALLPMPNSNELVVEKLAEDQAVLSRAWSSPLNMLVASVPRAKRGTVHTIPHNLGWANRVEGNIRVSNTAPTKAEALAKGRQMAINARVEHQIHNKDGRIGERRSYAKGPRRSKG